MSKSKEKKHNSSTLAENRKARFNYEILDTFEVGIVLTGAEIKSIRQGGASLAESYVSVANGELFLVGAHIAPYGKACTHVEIDPKRRRKLLMGKRDIIKLGSMVDTKGLTIVPLKIYLKRGWAKLSIGLGRGNKIADKRRTIAERDVNREISKAIKRR